MLEDVEAILGDERGPDAGVCSQVRHTRILLLIFATSLCYGAVMGTYGGLRFQIVISGLKVPVMILFTGALCLPSFFVFNTALGLRNDFGAAFRGVFSALATFAICLASLAPLLVMVYLTCSPTYSVAKLANGACFAVAAWAAQIKLARHYRTLVKRNPRHRYSLALWLVLYIFVAIQLAWVLRPFVGSPDLPVQVFRDNAWGNAYIEVWDALLQALAGK